MSEFEKSILVFLKKKPNSDLKRIKKGLELNCGENEYLEKELTKLEIEGLIYEDKNGLYCNLENKPSVCTGEIQFLNNGNIYVKGKFNNGFLIEENDISNVFPGDTVTCIYQYRNKKGLPYAKIDKILKRKRKQLSCKVDYENGHYKLIPYNKRNNLNILINEKEISKYGIGEILLIDISNLDKDLPVSVIKEIGHESEPDIDEKAIAYNYDFNTDFPKKVIKEISKLPSDVDIKSAIEEGRKDLRYLNTFTIDGKDAKDLDDSVAIEILPNGNYKLYVNIAHVAHYVKKDSEIDKEAFERGTSLYMNDTNIPMLPYKLCNGICSLHPNATRLTKTCEIIINKKGEIVDYDIYNSITMSKKKMSYEDVNKIIINNEKIDGYEDFYDDLKNMHQLSKLLEKQKIKRGYINFNTLEIKARNKGKDITFDYRVQDQAEKIIENFMLIANQTVAEHIFYRGLPFIYRYHDNPNEEEIISFLKLVDSLGYKFKNCNNVTSNKYIQNIVNTIENNCESKDILIDLLLITTMKRAKYSNFCHPHFGLAVNYYTHFTAPIRRYIDLTIQRMLDYYDKNYEFNYNEIDKNLDEIANHCNERTKSAEKAERDAKDMRIAEYMQNNIGKTFNGNISYIDSSIIKVKTEEGFIGKININELKFDKFEFSYGTNQLHAKNSNINFYITMPIKIKVVSASKSTKSIKFDFDEEFIKDLKGTSIKKTRK